MGFIADLQAVWSPPAVDGDWSDWHSGTGAISYSTLAGVTITEESALTIPTVWDCNKILTEAVSQLPLMLYDRLPDGGREKSADTKLGYLLAEQPNDAQSSFEFREEMQQTANFHKFAYAEIEWQRGQPVQVTPRHPSRIRVEKTASGKRRYSYQEDDNVTWRPILPEDMLRVPGTPVLKYAAQTFGRALALSRYTGTIFGRGVRPSALLTEEPGTVWDDPTRKVVKGAITDAHSGPDKAGGLLWVPAGLRYTAMGMTNEQAELGLMLGQVVSECARFWRIPPYMLGLLESGTVSYASVNTQGVDFVVYCLMPWLVRWEQAIGRDLILRKDSQFVEFLAAMLLRGTTKERYDVYAIALDPEHPIMDLDEVRKLENLNPRGKGWTPPSTAAAYAAARAEPDSPAGRLLHSLMSDNAGRMVRRETGALAKLAEKTGAVGPEWTTGVEEFYAGHGDAVATALKLPKVEAHAYAERQRTEVLAIGPGALAAWEADGLVSDLTELALEAHR